jgi:single-strand DNA-binding protein
MGRLTKDPEVRYTQANNTQVTSFTLAVNRRFTKDGEQQADFINCIAWSKTAEFVSKYFKKGQQVGVIGRLQTRTWDDDKGQKHYITEVIVEEKVEEQLVFETEQEVPVMVEEEKVEEIAYVEEMQPEVIAEEKVEELAKVHFINGKEIGKYLTDQLKFLLPHNPHP